MCFLVILKLRPATLRLSWALLVLGLGLTAIPARAATEIPLQLRHVPDKDKLRMTQEGAWRLQKEQAAAALLADRHQKAVRRFLMAGVNARAERRAAEISQQLGSTPVLTPPPGRSWKLPAIMTLLLVGGVSFFRWHRSRAG